MHATFRFLACAAAVSISACGGSAGTDDPFAAMAAGRSSAAAVAQPTPSPLSFYEFSTGRLQMRGLTVDGGSVCYDVILRTVVTAPIRVEITSALVSNCADPGAPAATYDSARMVLTAPKLAVLDTGLCYDVSMRTMQGSPMQLELSGATTTSCPPAPLALGY